LPEIPLRARLHRYRLTPSEFLLLTAMCEFRSDGVAVWASVPRIAAYAKISVRTAQRTIQRLLKRGVLVEISPADSAQRKPATYKIVESKLEADPKTQKKAGAISTPWCHGVTSPPSACHQTGVNLSNDSRSDSRFDSFPSSVPVAFDLQKKTNKTEIPNFGRKPYDPAVGDRIDWRKYCAAREQVQLKLNHGARMSPAEILQEQCVLSGLSTERALDLERQMLALPPGASA